MALSRQGRREVDKQQGEAIVFQPGWGGLWMKDNARFRGDAGPGLEVAHWAIEARPVPDGRRYRQDEVVPNPNPTLVYPVHSELLTKNGIFNHENLVFRS